MKKKHNTLVEHYLVPIALFVLNICLVHTVYLYAAGSAYSATTKIVITLTLAFLSVALILKTRSLLATSILLYAIVVVVA